MARPIVIKIGTSSLTGRQKGEATNFDLIDRLAKTISSIKQQQNVILVSSGAMGMGINKLKLQEDHSVYDDVLDFKAAITAIGQVELINAYEKAFIKYSSHVGQILITHVGLDDPGRYKRIQKSVEQLLGLGVIPIFNENDTVCPEEIEFGDNDKLAARVAKMAEASRLVILTDCDGLYKEDPHANPDAELIATVDSIDDEIKKIAGDSSTYSGLGGMKSKITAAEICNDAGITMNIINKSRIEEIPQLLQGNPVIGTEFKAAH